jgi:hypothetical protein
MARVLALFAALIALPAAVELIRFAAHGANLKLHWAKVTPKGAATPTANV